jgi:hypothetical protein
MMTVLAILTVIAIHHLVRHLRRGRGISILIPFQSTDPQRKENCDWLVSYWKAQLPGAEVVIGQDNDALRQGIPFSKSVAVNDAVKRSKGDILAVIDADGYVDAKSVHHCAKQIRKARRRGQKLWFVPYRHFYRLNKDAARLVLDSSPKNPFRHPMPPPADSLQGTDGNPQVGHWYGAMIQIMPREAFTTVGGWDTRFRGWGGEDHAAMRAMDTLYWPHKTVDTQVLHLWHPMLSPAGGKSDWVHWKERTWAGQTSHSANDVLSGRYYSAMGNPAKMRTLVDGGLTSVDPQKQQTSI